MTAEKHEPLFVLHAGMARVPGLWGLGVCLSRLRGLASPAPPVPALLGSSCYDTGHKPGGSVPGPHLSSHILLSFLIGCHLSPRRLLCTPPPHRCLRRLGPLLPMGLCLAFGLWHSKPTLCTCHGSSELQPQFTYLPLAHPFPHPLPSSPH